MGKNGVNPLFWPPQSGIFEVEVEFAAGEPAEAVEIWTQPLPGGNQGPGLFGGRSFGYLNKVRGPEPFGKGCLDLLCREL
jgi:hypothetical protein